MHHKQRCRLVAFFSAAIGWPLLLVVTYWPSSAARAEGLALQAALDSITTGELKAHVAALADDAFEGREAGTRGGQAAGNYLLEQFQSTKLRGGGDDGQYSQPFGIGYRNILAVLDGADPQLKGQFVVIGAHYDHVGYGAPSNSYGPTGFVHNGADDNASGAAAVLEAAEAFDTLPQAPRRSVLFALWDGEEKGYLGSSHWIQQSSVSQEQITLGINLDMIGRMRNHRVIIYGARTGRGFRRLVSMQNRDLGLDLDFTWELNLTGDHQTFFHRDVPFLLMHTGLHEDYHRPSDDAEKINVAGLQQIARLAFHVAHEAAEQSYRYEFRPAAASETEASRKRFETPRAPFPPRLGVSWGQREPAERGLRVTEVVPGSAAAKAGLRPGDLLIKCDERIVDDENQFRMNILAARAPVTITVERPGEDELIELDVELSGSPLRLGVSWREDDAEPGTVMLTRVAPGAPAHRAGLAPRDRIYAFAGMNFRDDNELLQLAATLPGPLDVLVERGGRLRTVTLAMPAFAGQDQNEVSDAQQKVTDDRAAGSLETAEGEVPYP